MKSPNFYFGFETHTDGGTKNGTDPENIAIGKIMKGSEISSVFAVLTHNVSITRFCSFCRNRDRSPRRERDRDRDRRDRERRHRDRDKSDRDRREVRTPTKTTHFYWLLLMFSNAHQKRRSAQVLKWQNCRQNWIHKCFHRNKERLLTLYPFTLITVFFSSSPALFMHNMFSLWDVTGLHPVTLLTVISMMRWQWRFLKKIRNVLFLPFEFSV